MEKAGQGLVKGLVVGSWGNEGEGVCADWGVGGEQGVRAAGSRNSEFEEVRVTLPRKPSQVPEGS